MSYTALYRRWRPHIFEEVIGQRHITDTLKNQIQSQNIAHAYLFSGTHGTGKTSIAKIMARAINCLNPVNQNPCNSCEICRGMLDETLMDIVEIDAASNNGVDDVRELRENVKYPPSKAKYKVYIIDEVHMLSQGAFNALLKTLEEPPGYVVFILATTEPQKIPTTILSRCQRYDFKRIPSEALVDHLNAIAKDLGIEAERKALELIVRNADGAARDALSILDQCISFSEGQLVYNDVVTTLGLTTEHWLFKIVDSVIDRKASETMKMVHEMVNDGKNLEHFIKSLTAHYRNLMLSKSGADLFYIMDSTEESIQYTKDQSERLSMNEILRSIDILTKLEAQSRWATQPRIHLEMTLVKLMQSETDSTLEGLLSRIETLERSIEAGVPVRNHSSQEASRQIVNDTPKARSQTQEIAKNSIPAVESSSVKSDMDETNINGVVNMPLTSETRSPVKNDTRVNAIENTASPVPDMPQNPSYDSDISIGEINAKWNMVLDAVKKMKVQVQAFLIEGAPSYIEAGSLMIAFKDGYAFHMDMIEREENRKIVEAAIEKVFAKSLRIRCDFDYNLNTSSAEEKNEMTDEEAVRTYFKDHESKLNIIE